MLPNSVELGPMSAKFGANSTTFLGAFGMTFAIAWPALTKIGPFRMLFRTIWAKFRCVSHIGPEMSNICRRLRESTQTCSQLGGRVAQDAQYRITCVTGFLHNERSWEHIAKKCRSIVNNLLRLPLGCEHLGFVWSCRHNAHKSNVVRTICSQFKHNCEQGVRIMRTFGNILLTSALQL